MGSATLPKLFTEVYSSGFERKSAITSPYIFNGEKLKSLENTKKFGVDLVHTDQGGVFFGVRNPKKRLQKADFILKKVKDISRCGITGYGKSHIVTLLFSVGYDN